MSKDSRVTASFIILNEKGLHTRPSTELVKCTSNFRSDIKLRYQNYTVDGKSLLGILMLAANRGAKIDIEAVGDDAREAVKCILDLSAKKFNIDY
ncbi:MAG: HPr family phosphocarrier protein [Rhabdochlamydiaceae bacterium]